MKSKPLVFISRKIPAEAPEMLSAHCRVEVNPDDRVLAGPELAEACREADGLLCLLTDRVDRHLLDRAPRLKAVANCAVGYDNIDLKACTEKGIYVSNTPGVLTEATADLTWALLLAVARRVVEADAYVRRGEFTSWAPMLFLGREISGRTLGIVGLGRIGKAVARRAKGFNMSVLYYSKKRKPVREEEALGVKYRPLEKLLAAADFLSLHVPLNASTRHLVGREQFKLMKPHAFFINTSRGPVVDEQALMEALRGEQIAGAALDVYENEPTLTPGLARLNNVVLLPHIASATVETRTKMAVMAAENLLCALQGKEMPNLVNRELAPGPSIDPDRPDRR